MDVLQLRVPPRPGECETEDYLDQRVAGQPLFEVERTRIEAQNQTALFCEAMQRFADSDHGKKCILEDDFDIRALHDWDGVRAAARIAEERYRNGASGIGGIFRKAFRNVGDYSDALEPWIKLIPTEGNYLAPLCGGLKVIIGAAAYRAQERDSILAVFQSLGDFHAKAKDWSDVFPDDASVRTHTLQAYIALLTMIEAHLRALIGDRVFKTIWKALKRDKEKRIEIQDARSSFNNAVDNLATKVQQLHMRRSKLQLDDIKETQQLHMKRSGEDFNQMAKIMSKMPQAVANVLLNGLKEFCLPQADPAEVQALSYQLGMQSDQMKHNLLAFLDVRGTDITQEVSEVKTMIQSIPCPSGGQFHWLSHHPVMDQWMCSRESSILHIFSESMGLESSPMSPMTLISLALTEGLRSFQQANVVQFFYGAHFHGNDGLRGSSGMVRSLIYQLLQKFSYDLNQIITPELEAAINGGALHELLYALLYGLPADVTLFCVVDQVHLCRLRNDEDILMDVVEVFRHLTANSRYRATLKIALVSIGNLSMDSSSQVQTIALPGDLEDIPSGFGPSILQERIMYLEESMEGEHLR